MVVKVGKHEVELYDTIEKLPIVRFHRYQKMMLLDAGLGGDLAAFDSKLERARHYILSGDKDNASKELENLRLAVYFIQNGITPRHRAFAALVRRVDGREFAEIGDAETDEILALLSDAPADEMDGGLSDVKKKMTDEISLYFPALFNDGVEKEYYDLLKRRTEKLLDGIIQGSEDPEADAEDLTIKVLLYVKPKLYTGSEGLDVQYDKRFETLCLILGEQLGIDAKTKTVAEFYNAFEYLQSRAKKQKARK